MRGGNRTHDVNLSVRRFKRLAFQPASPLLLKYGGEWEDSNPRRPRVRWRTPDYAPTATNCAYAATAYSP